MVKDLDGKLLTCSKDGKFIAKIIPFSSDRKEGKYLVKKLLECVVETKRKQDANNFSKINTQKRKSEESKESIKNRRVFGYFTG